jgi:mannose-6-phosphate isomerase-like protein (cupin superfamily)
MEPHQHLYEEALIFLNGAGVVWTERSKTTVGAGTQALMITLSKLAGER